MDNWFDLTISVVAIYLVIFLVSYVFSAIRMIWINTTKGDDCG